MNLQNEDQPPCKQSLSSSYVNYPVSAQNSVEKLPFAFGLQSENYVNQLAIRMGKNKKKFLK
jgi:hypothetical protein